MALLDKFKTLSVEDAQAAFNEKSEAFQIAFDESNKIKDKLSLAYEYDEAEEIIIDLEDANAKSYMNVSRAEKLRDAAHSRLAEVKQAQAVKASKELIKQRDVVLKRRIAVAKKFDQFVEPLKEAIDEFQEIDSTIRKLTNQGVVSPNARGTYGKTATYSMIHQVLFRAGIPGISKVFMSKPNRSNMKTITDQVKNSNKTILLIDEQPATAVTAAAVAEETPATVIQNPVDTSVIAPRQELNDGAAVFAIPPGGSSRFL